MKKCRVVLFALALIFTASYASAEGLYARGSIGASLVDDSTVTVQGYSGSAEIEFDTGLLFSAAIGSDLGNNTRVEGEVSYMTADVDRIVAGGLYIDLADEVNVLSLLVNCYYDIETGSTMTPFIGAGIGVANVEVEGDGSEDDTVFAYQAGAGIGYAVNDSTTLELGYRYMATSDPEFQEAGETVEAEVGSHNFYVGVRVAIQ